MPHEAEYQTRKRRKDARLKAMTPPWQIIRYQDGLDCARLHSVAVEEYPTENGPADYAGQALPNQYKGVITSLSRLAPDRCCVW